MPFRRRFKRRIRRTFGSKRPMFKRRFKAFKRKVTRVVKAISEKKFDTERNTFTSAIGAGHTGSVDPIVLGSITQGTGSFNRIGNNVQTKFCVINIYWELTSGVTPAVDNVMIRVIICQNRSKDALLPADFDQTINGHNFTNRYRTIRDFTFRMGDVAGGVSLTNKMQRIAFPWKVNWKWFIGGDAVQDDETKRLYMYFIVRYDPQTVVVSNNIRREINARVSFIDL